jgi:hypothetical protein
MVRFTGKNDDTVYSPQKPIRCGFKFYVLADPSNSYALRIKMHEAPEDPEKPKKNAILKILEELITHLKGKNHILFMDSYYMSFRTMKYLFQH